MAVLKEILPPAKSSVTRFYDHSSEPWFKQRYSDSTEDEKADIIKTNPPKTPVDDRGNLTFDAILKQNKNAKKIVYSQHRDLIHKILKDEEEHEDEKQKEIEKTTQQTKKVVVNVMLSAAQPKSVQTQSQDSKFIKYKPSQQSAAFDSGAEERIIRMVEMPVDPLEPPKFKHKRVPKANGSPPKNPKGYTIPLDKRLAADGRGLQEVQINDNFAQLSDSLYVAEQQASEDVTMRSKVEKEMMMKEKSKNYVRWLKKPGLKEPVPGPPLVLGRVRLHMMDWDPPREWFQRDKIREERRRERKRERRLEAKDAVMAKKSKIIRDQDHDISEKVALGMASAGSARGGEVMYDQRYWYGPVLVLKRDVNSGG
ncbi:hypothetical protein L1987_48980 [Smallanthus sonchifolius]|uniref:Uncharacterized protein n=1 Tax=Smallanthus sonchifolius TaxID=185202 RepID=A0ACB9FUE7_9ASTR|nr:hypothetical protein L1987_48980 [Smallanthus sonchifolius]